MTDEAEDLWYALYQAADPFEQQVLRILGWKAGVAWVCCGALRDLHVGTRCPHCFRSLPTSLDEALNTTPRPAP